MGEGARWVFPPPPPITIAVITLRRAVRATPTVGGDDVGAGSTMRLSAVTPSALSAALLTPNTADKLGEPVVCIDGVTKHYAIEGRDDPVIALTQINLLPPGQLPSHPPPTGCLLAPVFPAA
eukprot:gene50200-55707_t